ncbi:MAG: hypothetical protein PHE73_09115 [Sulfurovaceae bacterium]|nr:hypothetical protein [Sulfurovaceae bacterium]
MKKYSKCSNCGCEDVFKEDDENKVCTVCRSYLLQEMIGNVRHGHIMTYEQFLKPRALNPFKDTPCRCRLPGGRFCDAIEGHTQEISVIGCLKCQIRITDKTLSDVMNEDEYAIE